MYGEVHVAPLLGRAEPFDRLSMYVVDFGSLQTKRIIGVSKVHLEC